MYISYVHKTNSMFVRDRTDTRYINRRCFLIYLFYVMYRSIKLKYRTYRQMKIENKHEEQKQKHPIIIGKLIIKGQFLLFSKATK